MNGKRGAVSTASLPRWCGRRILVAVIERDADPRFGIAPQPIGRSRVSIQNVVSTPRVVERRLAAFLLPQRLDIWVLDRQRMSGSQVLHERIVPDFVRRLRIWRDDGIEDANAANADDDERRAVRCSFMRATILLRNMVLDDDRGNHDFVGDRVALRIDDRETLHRRGIVQPQLDAVTPRGDADAIGSKRASASRSFGRQLLVGCLPSRGSPS